MLLVFRCVVSLLKIEAGCDSGNSSACAETFGFLLELMGGARMLGPIERRTTCSWCGGSVRTVVRICEGCSLVLESISRERGEMREGLSCGVAGDMSRGLLVEEALNVGGSVSLVESEKHILWKSSHDLTDSGILGIEELISESGVSGPEYVEFPKEVGNSLSSALDLDGVHGTPFPELAALLEDRGGAPNPRVEPGVRRPFLDDCDEDLLILLPPERLLLSCLACK